MSVEVVERRRRAPGRPRQREAGAPVEHYATPLDVLHASGMLDGDLADHAHNVEIGDDRRRAGLTFELAWIIACARHVQQPGSTADGAETHDGLIASLTAGVHGPLFDGIECQDEATQDRRCRRALRACYAALAVGTGAAHYRLIEDVVLRQRAPLASMPLIGRNPFREARAAAELRSLRASLDTLIELFGIGRRDRR